MYGYLRLVNGTVPLPALNGYKRLYCTLCHALWHYYGLRSRLLLSYDMTFFAAVLDLKNHVRPGDRFLCWKKAGFGGKDESWKRIAAMTVLLAAKKLEDDVADDHDLKAKAGLRFFNKAAKKAENDYPEAARLFREGFGKMTEMEKQSADVFAMARQFGDIMTAALRLTYERPPEDAAVLRHVTEWVYFIDAADDLEADVKDGNYNPFKTFAPTKEELVRKNYDYLERFISGQTDALRPVLEAYSGPTERNCIILSTLTGTIPFVTLRVLSGEKPFPQRSPLIRMLEPRGGYRLV